MTGRKPRLQRVLEAFIATYGGALRLREIKILLLVQQGTRAGTGVSISEVAKQSDTPLESVRRQLKQYQKAGLLRAAPDPRDRRVVRYFATDAAAGRWPLGSLTRRLNRLLGPCGAAASGPPLAQLLALIELFIRGYMGSIRIRGARMALLVYSATLEGTGIAVSELARINDAPLETVRRMLTQHVEMGHIRLVQDPEDDRRTLVVIADLTLERQRITEMNRRLAAIERAWVRPLRPARAV